MKIILGALVIINILFALDSFKKRQYGLGLFNLFAGLFCLFAIIFA